jgi:hypothetical protein
MRERAIRSAFARSLEPSCQHDSCQYRPSRKIREVLRGFSHRAQWISWASVPSCISPSDLAAVLSLVTTNGSYVSIEFPAKPATRESTVVMTGMPRNRSCRHVGFFLRFCQLIEADIGTRQTSMLSWSYLPLKQRTPCRLSRPSSRIVSSSLGGTPTQTTDADAVGSVGRWGHTPLAQFLAVCRRLRIGAMATRRP